VLDRKTTVTFTEPVEIPGVGAQVLPAGTYVFTLVDQRSDRGVVRITDKAGKHVFATILAVPTYRMKATGKTVMTFAERSAGSPEAIRAWFYPGEHRGQEFVYPKTKALALAKVTHTPILYVSDEVAPVFAAPVPVATEPPAPTLTTAPLMAVNPAGDDVAVADIVAPPAQSTERPERPDRLPRTATEMPLLALMGLLSLGVGLSLRRSSCAR
jgi:hypothetical protein